MRVVKVPLLDLVAQHAEVGAAVEEAVRRVLASGQFILGPQVAELEAQLAARLGRKHAVGVSSGSDALLVTLMALGVGPGDEVVTTPLTFFATAGAIVRLGARPVFADIDPTTLNLDPAAALRAVGPRTKAILPVHLFGRAADVAPLRAAGLPIVEDAAQALGAAGVGEVGVATTLSFFPSKNLGAAGDGGMVLTDDAALAERVRLMRTHGSRPKYVHGVVGGNFRLDTIQAAVLLAKLPFLDGWQRRRAANARRYREGLAGTPLGLPEEVPGHVWHHYVVRAPRRDELRVHLRERGIETEVYYPLAMHLQPCFRDLGGREGDLPEAERATREVLALPVHPDLSAAQIDHVIDVICAFFAPSS
jgi:dTDP-4-amino-4,6-dideoxygalactose transaminase